MKTLFLVAVLAVAAPAFAQSGAPDAPEAPDAPGSADPAASPEGAGPGTAAPAAAEAPAKAPPPFTLGRGSEERNAPSPYAVDTQFGRPPNVYVIPMEGLMGLDIHEVVYAKILADLKEKKPDLVVFRLKSSNHGEKDSYMEAVANSSDEDKVDPRRLASAITDYRDLAARQQSEIGSVPSVMYVVDARGVSCVYALAWPYMFMAPDSKIAGLDIVTELAGGNDDDIKAKMLSAWTGIAKGVLELGGHPQALADALVRPDRVLSADIEGRSTRWRADTDGSWIVVDTSMETAARFPAKLAEDTGLTEGLADDVPDVLGQLGYPEFTIIDSGEKIFRDSNAAWRRRFEESKKWMEEFQEEMADERELSKKKAIIEKMLQNFKQSPQLARMWQWTRGIDETQLRTTLDQINEQIRAYQKSKSSTRGSKGSKGGGGGGPGAPFGR
jgi:hypothetical protein